MSAGSTTDRENLTLELRDGRRLGYAEYGDPAGKPVFHFHGYPGSRLEGAVAAALDPLTGVRLIAVDRPGMGLSDFQPRRQIVDWPSDVAELADVLKIDRFVVEGVSGGGPYSLVCAHRLPDRVTGAVVVAGVGPMDSPEATEGMKRSNRILFRLSRISPLAIRPIFWQMSRTMRRDPEKAMESLGKEMPPADKAAVESNKKLASLFIQDTLEAFRTGTKGAGWEGYIYVRPWGFDIREIRVPVRFWQGDQDVNVPKEMAPKMAGLIPGAKLTMVPGEGHVSLVFRHLGEILKASVEKAGEPPAA